MKDLKIYLQHFQRRKFEIEDTIKDLKSQIIDLEYDLNTVEDNLNQIKEKIKEEEQLR